MPNITQTHCLNNAVTKITKKNRITIRITKKSTDNLNSESHQTFYTLVNPHIPYKTSQMNENFFRKASIVRIILKLRIFDYIIIMMTKY